MRGRRAPAYKIRSKRLDRPQEKPVYGVKFVFPRELPYPKHERSAKDRRIGLYLPVLYFIRLKMPSGTSLTFKPVHKTFCAEVEGIDWTQPLSSSVIEEIRVGIDKYGVLIFRKANVDDFQQEEFARNYGELTQGRFSHQRPVDSPYIFDLSNIDKNGDIIKVTDPCQILFPKGNELWHADMQHRPQRALYSILRAVEIPPAGCGGETQYADSRTAYEDLDAETKGQIENMVMRCSLIHNRQSAAPELYKGIDPLHWPNSRWKPVYTHEGSGRKNLYVTSYMYCMEGMTPEESAPIIKKLLDHATQEKYVYTVEWKNVGDMIMWDNTSVLHRATDSAPFQTKYRRDVRRATALDSGAYAWGENEPNHNFGPYVPEDPFAPA